MPKTSLAGIAACLWATTAAADVPRVATDIAPVHSLVARVMEGAGEPALILPPGSSPHGHSMRPSEASALQEADLVFWIGPELTPGLSGALRSLAADAEVVSLLEANGVLRLPFREGALFEAHGHAHEEDEHGDDMGHDDGHDDGHADHADHGPVDPHAWLAPANAATWMDLIAARLSEADPANAALYRANADAGREEMDALGAEIEERLGPVRGGRFVVFHDAYRYFEEAFDMPASGAISLGDASRPSPARIAAIRDRISGEGVACVLSEPQFAQGLIGAVMGSVPARTAVVDPLGASLNPGPDLYAELMRRMADSLANCLDAEGT